MTWWTFRFLRSLCRREQTIFAALLYENPEKLNTFLTAGNSKRWNYVEPARCLYSNVAPELVTKPYGQEGGINSSRQRVRMRVAIVTSRRKKHAGSKWFRKWRRRLGKTPTFQADFLHSFTFQVFYVWIQKIDYNPSFWRGKWLITVGENNFTEEVWRVLVIFLEWEIVLVNFVCAYRKTAFIRNRLSIETWNLAQ